MKEGTVLAPQWRAPSTAHCSKKNANATRRPDSSSEMCVADSDEVAPIPSGTSTSAGNGCLNVGDRGGRAPAQGGAMASTPFSRITSNTFFSLFSFRTPAMIGCSFVVDREYFGQIGLLDPGMEVYGGENIELGMRVSRETNTPDTSPPPPQHHYSGKLFSCFCVLIIILFISLKSTLKPMNVT